MVINGLMALALRLMLKDRTSAAAYAVTTIDKVAETCRRFGTSSHINGINKSM